MTHWKVRVSAGNGLLRPDRQGAQGSRLHLQRMCPDMHDSRRYTATSTTVTGQKLSHCSHNRQAKSITRGKVPLRLFNIKVALAKGRWGNIGKINISPLFPLIDTFQKQLSILSLIYMLTKWQFHSDTKDKRKRNKMYIYLVKPCGKICLLHEKKRHNILEPFTFFSIYISKHVSTITNGFFLNIYFSIIISFIFIILY